ncbi:hypothetical protein [Ferruginibacter sp.]|uniref:hypothetical protein n=1 Tax=Ferruginibacter sp. TaxID=1940288 RepID=UPI0019B59CB9|nr:hypothetical protein [Ferruginibacter sp.]MBC7626604.1 hypothetical protein [Ferruginibacter sp.]
MVYLWWYQQTKNRILTVEDYTVAGKNGMLPNAKSAAAMMKKIFKYKLARVESGAIAASAYFR